jgi:deazaflavin-dependent oxidoreductase (nitroreductase family)
MATSDPTPLDRRSRDDAVVAELRAGGGRSDGGGMPLVLLHTTGSVSGRLHLKPVCVREDGADLIVAATMGGNPRHPQWYVNLVAHPTMTVEYQGETFTATATTVPNSVDRDRLFAMMAEVIQGMYGYQDRCRDQRQIPIVRLVHL